MRSGKWYWEMTPITSAPGQSSVGMFNSLANTTSWLGAGTNSWGYWSDGQKYTNASGSAYGASWGAGDVIGVAIDADAGSITFYKNNVSQGVAYSGLTAPFYAAVNAFSPGESMAVNFGQQGFKYTPPSGFVALNTFNLPAPTIGATATTQANRYMDATLYTGTGSSNAVVNAGGFQPDFVWIKSRSNAYPHFLYDAVRTAGKYLASNNTDAETTTTQMTSFNSNGFTVNNDGGSVGTNNNGSTFVGWQWNAGGSTVTNTSGSISAQVRANTSAGFSVVTYTGTGSNLTFGHGLGVKPSMVIVKPRSHADNWVVWNKNLPTPTTAYMYLNATDASANSSVFWNSTEPTSTVVSIGVNSNTNQNGGTYVAYCFSEVAGYSKFGSFTGNGSSDNTFVYTGFRPRFVLIKRTDGASNWFLLDSSRSPSNVADDLLRPNLSDAEITPYTLMDFVSNGIKLREGGFGSGETYIYMAFAETPFNYANAR
jgi:hypothetical protein